ncbi:MAG TPA: universal stress protein [Allosphingosinicella sp.]|nr:universal stress protein [Allosphingosinicella sp.]
MYKNILVAVDADEPDSWADALPVAAVLARCFSARLTLCSVVRDMEAELQAEWSPIGYREMLELAKVKLLELAATLPDLTVEVEVGTGTVCRGILQVAERVQADLVVLASHMPELKDYLLSANAARVARRAPCSVLVVRRQTASGDTADAVADAFASAG